MRKYQQFSASFGEATMLTREQQRKVKGALFYFRDAPGAQCPPDSKQPSGCPCTGDGDCFYNGPVNPKWRPIEYLSQDGFCGNGSCV